MNQIKAGDHLVLPHHGAGTVTDITEQDGRRLLQIEFDHRDLSMTLPEAVATKRGARKVISTKAAKEVFATLKGDSEPLPDDHRERSRIVAERAVSLDAIDLAGLLRDLQGLRAAGRKLSVTEMRAFEQTREHLASELGLVRSVTTIDAMQLIDGAIGLED